ncbi:FG-GAP repeat domain-containing protein [Actinoplanes sp. CA-054009]
MAASTPSEVTVIPADETAYYWSDEIGFAGSSGFLHRHSATSNWVWTTYADGRSTVIRELGTTVASQFRPTGGDSFSVGPFEPSVLKVYDARAGLLRRIPVPGPATFLYGTTLVTSSIKPELRDAATGAVIEISGLPADLTRFQILAGDENAVVVRAVSGTSVHYGFLDVHTGAFTAFPVLEQTPTRVLLTTDRVAFVGSSITRVFDRSANPVAFYSIAIPSGRGVGLAGDSLILGPSGYLEAARRYRVIETTLVAHAGNTMVQGPDGVVYLGGADAADWSVRVATATGDRAVLPLNTEQTSAGLTFTQGVVRHIQAQPHDGAVPDLIAVAHPLFTGDGETTHATRLDGIQSNYADGNGYGLAYLAPAPTAGWIGLRLRDREDTGLGSDAVLPSAGGKIVDASLSHVIVNGTNPARQYIVNYGASYYSGAVTGAGLWFETLWSAAPGKLQPRNLRTKAFGTAVPTGSACTATEVQATARFVYWSCGVHGPAGVYDLARKVNTTLPAAEYLLGDNYLVWHGGNGALVRRDLRQGTMATLATFPRGELADDRNVTWAVDKFGGDVAYVDAQGAVHVVDPGTTPTAPAAGIVNVDTELGFGPYSAWGGSVNPTRPVDSWKLTITRVATGKVVATQSDGPARRTLNFGWNGMVAGKRANSGHYRWTVTGTADATTSTLASGVFTVDDGTPNLHSYEYAGMPSLLGISKSPAGQGHWLISSPSTAALRDNGATDNWAGATAIVPFGDISKDFHNDLLVRFSNGTMRAYLGIGQSNFGGRGSVAIPGNWNRFNAIVHTGDLTGDGQADLLAREASTGRLFRFTGNGKGGFSSAAAYPNTYKGVSRFVGPGDITGDGKADLILIYGTTMYAWYGNGSGGFTPGLHLIGSGYLGFNTIIGAGDLNEDGKNDLLMRNSAGVLWRKLGNGKGGFGPLQLVGTGYQKYASLY